MNNAVVNVIEDIAVITLVPLATFLAVYCYIRLTMAFLWLLSSEKGIV